MKPQRIQRKRTKGFNLPPNTICVTRPGPWGNPFTGDPAEAVEQYQQMLLKNREYRWAACEALRGKNLACYCKIGAPCHADILLKLVNLE
jgi:hypothetical protein